MERSYLKIMIAAMFFVFLTTSMLSAQVDPPESRMEMDALYKKNIKKTRINGVYIPKDIEEAFEEFIHLSAETSLDQFKIAHEESVAQKLHFGIGRWMIVNWNFYGGSRLEHLLKSKGLMHPDDMADFLIVTFHRKLNEREEKQEELIASMIEKRKEEQKKMGKIHFN